MADLRGGTTIGGKPIATVDMVNQIVGFNAADYVARNATLLANGYDLNTILTTGYYRCFQGTNRPTLLNSWAYIEVIRHDDNWVLQKMYNYEGTMCFFRTKTNGAWYPWRAMGLLTYKINIGSPNWVLDSGYDVNMYYQTITHSLGTKDISVTVTSTTGSVLPVFKFVDDNSIKVYVEDNTMNVRVLINAV